MPHFKLHPKSLVSRLGHSQTQRNTFVRGIRSVPHYADNKCSPELHFPRLSRISQKTSKATVNSPRLLEVISSTVKPRGGKSFCPHRVTLPFQTVTIGLSENLVHHMAMHIGQTDISTTKSEREFLVVNSQLMHHSRVNVLDH